MKRLVLLGEGHGEVSALPALVGRLLREKDTRDTLFVDHEVIREPNPVKWDKQAASPDYSKWVSRVTLAARRRSVLSCGLRLALLRGHRRPVHDRCRCRGRRGQDLLPGGGICLRRIRDLDHRRDRVPRRQEIQGWAARAIAQPQVPPWRTRIPWQEVARTKLSGLSANPGPNLAY